MAENGALHIEMPSRWSVGAYQMSPTTAYSCAPTNWWSAAALGGLMAGGGGVGGVGRMREH